MKLNPFKGGKYDLSRTIKSILPGGDKVGAYINPQYDIDQKVANDEAIVSGLRKIKPVAVTSVAPTPQVAKPTQPVQTAQPPQPQYNQAYVNFMNNVSAGRTKKSQTVPQDLKTAVSVASKNSGIPEAMLYALANKETNLRNIGEIGGTKAGRGYFQIDKTWHPEITDEQANDPNFAANWAANYLNNKLKTYSSYPAPVSTSIRAYNGSVDNPKTKAYLDEYINYLGDYNYE